MDPASAFGVAVGVAQFVDLAVDVACGLSRYFHSVKQAPKLSRELQQEALLVSLVLKELKSTLVATNHVQTTTRLGKTLSDIVEEFKEAMTDMQTVVMIKDGDFIKRLRWPFTEGKNKEYFSNLERYKNTFTLALTTIQRYVHSLIMKIDYSHRLQRVDSTTQDIHKMSLGNNFV